MVEKAKTPRNKMILWMALATGMRVGKLEQLKKSDIDMK